MTNPKRVIIDTDPGIDDALAILLALASPELQIEGLATVSGNGTVEVTTRNALAILELGGHPEIPVFQGAGVPLIQPLLIASDTHGDFGLGYANLPEPHQSPRPQPAVQFLIDTVLANPDEITIIAIGPLSNLALAIRLEPNFAPAVRDLIIMGGAIRHGGNQTPQAEFNTYCDPHAAHIVFHSGIPITLVPLDVTYQTLLTRQDVARLLEIASPISTFVEQSTRFYMEYHHTHQSLEGCVINDPLAICLAFAPGLVDLQTLYVDVDISNGVSLGKTFADFFNILNQPPNMHVALGVRDRDYIELVLERLAVLCRSHPSPEQPGKIGK